MAVTFVRSALMVPGKFPQAHEYLEKRIKWLKEKFGVEPSLMVLLGGQVSRPRSQSRIASLRSRRSGERSSAARFQKSSPPGQRVCSCPARQEIGSG